MPNLEYTFFRTKGLQAKELQAKQLENNKTVKNHTVNISSISNCTLTHCRLPFNYSRLTYALSICLMAQLCMMQEADALEPTKPEGIESELYNPNLGKAQIQTAEETEEALVALKLKKAVEQGLIDPSVLEDYQRETLNSPVKPSVSQQNSQPQVNNPSQVKDQSPSEALSQWEDSANSSSEITDSDYLSNEQAQEVAESSDSIFNRIFADNSLQSPNAGNGLANAQIMQSPQQIDKTLADINEQVWSEFDQPIARLDSVEPPIGFDEALDQSDPLQAATDSASTASDTDTNYNTNANDEQLEGTKPVFQATEVRVNPDSEEAKSAEDTAHQAVKNTPIGQVDEDVKNADGEITHEVVAEAQQNGVLDSGIDPDEYLPEYDESSNQSQFPINAEDNTVEEDDSEPKLGLFKRLYNRWFNDGYASLPKISAEIYLQPEGETYQSQRNLIKADKNAQPFTNIKAAMENITAESISDFTAVTPKLNQEALNAAQAVGYYDIDMSFQKISSDKVAVIVEHLGDPVKVSYRNVDIRGEGEELEEFKTIAHEAPPSEEDVFNHGVYKKAKQRIETASDKFGFFDGQWLNKSVDVILPDNTADVDLVYDTGERYHFDEVVFFTIDKETNQLTTDPDKLPVKLELLHQLHDFKAGDEFYAPEVTEFTNDLSATRYFNSVNVETIKPISSGATLGFDSFSDSDGDEEEEVNQKQSLANEDQLLGENTLESATVDEALANNKNATSVELDQDSQQQVAVNNTNNDNNVNENLNSDLQPIEYSVEQETTDKLNEITAKAQRLSRLPDDRVLDETEEEAKSLLGKISNAISNAAKKIFPDDKSDFSDTSDLPSDLSKTVLGSRKTPQEVAETKSVPLYVFVTADKPRDVDLGIGYGTDTGVRAVARMEHNLINREGYQAGISVGASRINKSVNLNASRPWKHPLDDTLNANLSYEQETIDQGEGNLDLDTNTIKAGLSRNIRKDSGWNRTYSVRYRQDELESGVKGPARENLPVPFNRDDAQFEQEALLLGYQIDKTVSDNVTNPTKGWRQYYSIEAGSEGLLTDTDMAIARAGVSGIYSFGEMNKHQVVGSLDGGYIWADDFKDVPYKIRFFAGGDRSIRGYDYNSLSALEKGYLVGGQVLAVGSAEYNYEFKPGFRGAVFADVGNAYDKDFEAETKLGLGFGVRWASPVGMVRVDLAAGVLEDSIPIRLHFFIGSPLQ